MKEHIQPWGDLEKAINRLEQDKQYWLSPFGRHIDSVTGAQPGAFWGRQWQQYDEILHHNGAPHVIEYGLTQFGTNPRIVDAGCAAGIALAEMRMYMPHAELYGVDVRDATQWSFIPPHSFGEGFSVEDFLTAHQIQFYQESHHNIPTLLPPYDILLCVGAMPDVHSPAVLQSYILKQFYKGLSEGGIAQVLLQTSEEHLPRIVEELQETGAVVDFTQGDYEILKRNFFNVDNGMWGTMTVRRQYTNS